MSDKRAAEAANQPEQPGAQDELTEGATEPAAEDPTVDLQTALAAAEQKAAENRDNYLRLAAELENLRKRTQRDLENAHKFALERFLGDLLPVKDSLEMGTAAAGTSEAASIKEGMDMTLNMIARHVDFQGFHQ